MTDEGNAVTAEWVGPSGMQLWNGVVMTPGVVVSGVGYDEAKDSSYWKIIEPDENTEIAGDDSGIRMHGSFGREQGGGATGRPELPDAPADVPEFAKTPSTPPVPPTITPVEDATPPVVIEHVVTQPAPEHVEGQVY